MNGGYAMKFSSTISDYKAYKQQDKSKNTVDAYISDLEQFFKFCKKDIEDVKNEDTEMFKEYLLKVKIKPKTVNRKLVSIRQFYEYINSNREQNDRIFLSVKLIKIQKQEYLEEVLSKSDFDRLIKAAEEKGDNRAIAIFYGLYLTGMRVSELLQICVDDVEKENIDVKGKGSKYREILIPDRLNSIWNEYLKARECKDNPMLFLNLNNRTTMNRQSVHNLIKKYAGIAKVKLSKAHAHNFRHMYCFRLVDKGLDLGTIADLAGHTDINTTKIYTRKTKKELLKTIKEL